MVGPPSSPFASLQKTGHSHPLRLSLNVTSLKSPSSDTPSPNSHSAPLLYHSKLPASAPSEIILFVYLFTICLPSQKQGQPLTLFFQGRPE